MNVENWIFPLTILPGVGLIIMSTTNWSVSLANEINALLNNPACDRNILRKKIAQLSLVNNALVSLYLSAALCVLAGFAGSLWTYGTMLSAQWIVTVIVIAGIAALLVATTMLIIYSLRAVRIKRQQFIKRLE